MEMPRPESKILVEMLRSRRSRRASATVKMASSSSSVLSQVQPLSVPQGIVGLFTRFGMDVTLAHPEGYEILPEVEEIAAKNAEASGGSFKKVTSMEEAFKDADIVYPKSWAPFKAMEKRTQLYREGDKAGIDALEKELLAQNAEHKDWSCTEDMMKLTKDGKALYMHCLPAAKAGEQAHDALGHAQGLAVAGGVGPGHGDLLALQVLHAAHLMDDMEHIGHGLGGVVHVAPVPGSPLPPPATCWAWTSRTWTRRPARSPTARLSGRPPTWQESIKQLDQTRYFGRVRRDTFRNQHYYQDARQGKASAPDRPGKTLSLPVHGEQDRGEDRHRV